ncbi:hypothetical protein PIB30_050331 [Stylosanthes scabra]|uniref:Uncharacterized protein n=1 Tax=Stylosanthes scabra TaxID=79078 RepID=A0ABU6THB9_9FABA|nr:hypothetical protein [Stylosanthes scabra]
MGPSLPSGHHRYGLPQDMYEIFTCGEQTMDHIAHEYIASRTSDDAIYRPLLQPHLDPAEQCQGFQYYHPSQQSYLPPSPQHYHTPSPQQQYYQSASQPSPIQPQHDDPSYHSAPKPSPHQIVRPRAQQPQRDRHPPPCGTSSHLHHRPAHGGDRA